MSFSYLVFPAVSHAQGRRSLGCFSQQTGEAVPCYNPRPPAPVGPPPPTAEELEHQKEEAERQQQEQDLREATEDAWDKGVTAYRNHDFNAAVRYFEEAIRNDRDRPGFESDDPDLLRNLKAARMMTAKANVPQPTSAFSPAVSAGTTAAPSAPLQPKSEPLVRIGSAAAVRGDVFWIADDGTKVRVTSGKTIYLNKQIITGPTGHLQVLLLDETVFTLGPNSDMVLDEFVYDPNTTSEKVIANFVKGTFRFVTGKVAHHDPEHMKIKLPVGSLGVRGTEIGVFYQPAVGGHVELIRGDVVVTPTEGLPFSLKPGQMVVIKPDGTFGHPSSLSHRR